VDLRDLSVVAEYVRSPWSTFEAVGRRQGMTGAAVRARLAKMRAHGFLLDCVYRVDPRLFGREEYVFEAHSVSNPVACQQMLTLREVVTVLRSLDGHLLGRCYAPLGSPPDLEAIAEVAGVPQDALVCERVPRSNPVAELSPTERNILSVMVTDPCASAASIAKATGSKASTVQRLQERLVATNAVGLDTLLQPARAQGLVIDVASVNSPESAERLQNVMPTISPWNRFGTRQLLICPSRSLHEARELRSAILREVPGATFAAWSDIAHDPSRFPEWLAAYGNTSLGSTTTPVRRRPGTARRTASVRAK
jgi:DNA-binding Lrp family transcriptional regulator